MILQKLKDFSNLIVLPHSVFALPFALASLMVATDGRPSLRLLGLVLLAMFFARTSAMAYNRFIDADLDALNPRTKEREIPTGKVSKKAALALMIVTFFAFIITCGYINRFAYLAAAPVMSILYFYSYTKRFTWLSHVVLGLCLGMAPVGAWVAARGHLDFPPLLLMAAVICFLAGFDILYASEDVDFDKAQGLQSWVVRWGARNSMYASRLFHLAMLMFLAAFGIFAGIGDRVPYIPGISVLGVFLFYHHAKVYKLEERNGVEALQLTPDLFKLNGWISLLYFCVVVASLWF